MTLATRYECRLRLSAAGLCDRGDGQPKRKRCSYCGGDFRVEQGRWGVFVWTEDGRYPEPSAISIHASRKLAERAAGRDYVVRWLS